MTSYAQRASNTTWLRLCGRSIKSFKKERRSNCDENPIKNSGRIEQYKQKKKKVNPPPLQKKKMSYNFPPFPPLQKIGFLKYKNLKRQKRCLGGGGAYILRVTRISVDGGGLFECEICVLAFPCDYKLINFAVDEICVKKLHAIKVLKIQQLFGGMNVHGWNVFEFSPTCLNAGRFKAAKTMAASRFIVWKGNGVLKLRMVMTADFIYTHIMT